jgi:hypothetical protein
VNEARWPLSPRAARVYYGLADAWIPGGGDRDVVAALASQLRTLRERRSLERTLWLLEWSPRFLLRSLRGLAWMERDARRAWLAQFEQSRVEFVRLALAALRARVEQSHEAAQSFAGS